MSDFQHSMADDAGAQTFVLKKTVVMVGMMGAGKTAVGRALAQLLAVPFVDSDLEIEAAANRTVPEIFARDGEVFFRARETEVISRLLGEESCILSTGGGAFLSQENRVNFTRPLLRTSNPKETLAHLFAVRVPEYSKADLRVPCVSGISIEATAKLVLSTLLTRPDVLERVNA